MTSRRIAAVPESATVAIADLAAQMRSQGLEVIDFSAGRAAEHSPPAAIEAAARAMRDGLTHQTPARGMPDYLAACAAKLARDNGVEADPASEIIATRRA